MYVILKEEFPFKKLLDKKQNKTHKTKQNKTCFNFPEDYSWFLLKIFSSRKYNSVLQDRFRTSGKATALISIFPCEFVLSIIF